MRVVGPVVNVDTDDLPHPKNQRGELGKALFNWYRNTVSKDPLTRVSRPTRRRSTNFLNDASRRRDEGRHQPAADASLAIRRR